MRDTTASAPREFFSTALWLDVIALALAGAGNAVMAARLNLVPLALGLIGIGFLIRLVQVRTQFFKIPLLLPWLLFLVSAWIGVTVSFDPALSLRKFDLILGGVALCFVLATTRTELAKRLIVWGLLLIGAGVALYYLTQTDFKEYPTLFTTLDQIGFLIHRAAPQFGLHSPHPNLIAGILLLILPFAIGSVYDAVRHKRMIEGISGGVFALLLTFALVMTTSRGALLALGAVVGVSVYAYVAARVAKRVGLTPSVGLGAALNLLLVIALIGILFGGGRLSDLLGSVNGISRPVLYQQVAQLAQDYPFTGAGLDTFAPHYSTYELLIYVPFLPHAHNLELQIWFEQGVLGLFAFAWLVLAYYVWCVQRRARTNWLAVASIAAMTLMLLHGLVDVLFYFSRVISLMFISFGLTICALEPFTPLKSAQKNSRRGWIIGAGAASVLLALGALLFFARRNQLEAQWLANLGTLKQAQLELPKIQYPNPTFSQVRRETDLSEAEEFFQEALRLDPTNRVGHARLGMIELERAEFKESVQHLEAAYASDKNNRAVIKALGQAYVWTGQFDQAQVLLKQIPEASVEMNYAIETWQQRGRNDLADNAQKMVQRLKP